MTQDNFTTKAQEALQHAQFLAQEKGHQIIEDAHIALGILEVDPHSTPF